MLRRCLAKRCTFRTSTAFSTSSSQWIKRFLTPSEEKELYLSITKSFRETLAAKSLQNQKQYQNVLENIFSTTSKPTLPPTELEQLISDMDHAENQGSVSALDSVQQRMNVAKMSTPIYNRLIRSYIRIGHIDKAEHVLDNIEDYGLLRTVRSFTYLIQAHVRVERLDRARKLVDQMEDLSLNKPLSQFDCTVLAKFYMASGDTIAMENFWRHIREHVHFVRSGFSLYTPLIDWCVRQHRWELLAQVADTVCRTSPIPSEHDDYRDHTMRSLHRAARVLAETGLTKTSERLLLYLFEACPEAPPERLQDITKQIVTSFICKKQDQGVLAFLGRLREAGVPNNVLSTETLDTIEQLGCSFHLALTKPPVST